MKDGKIKGIIIRYFNFDVVIEFISLKIYPKIEDINAIWTTITPVMDAVIIADESINREENQLYQNDIIPKRDLSRIC